MAKTRYVWSSVSDSVLQEKDGTTGATQVTYTNEPAPYGPLRSERRGSETRQYHFDALGSTRALTDDNQTVTDAFTYDAWGKPPGCFGTTKTRFQWNGRLGYQLQTPAMYFVRRSTYNARVAAWLARDPGWFWLSSKLYVYSRNNPAAIVDASGLAPAICNDCEAAKATAYNDPEFLKLAACLRKQGCKNAGVECSCCTLSGQRGCAFIDDQGEALVRLCCGYSKEDTLKTLLHESIHALRYCERTRGEPPGPDFSYPSDCSSCLAEEIVSYICSGQASEPKLVLDRALSSCQVGGLVGKNPVPPTKNPASDDPSAINCGKGKHPNFKLRACQLSDFPEGKRNDIYDSIINWVLREFGEQPSKGSPFCKKHYDNNCGSLLLPTLPRIR